MSDEKHRRFDDSWWGQTFKFWPLTLAVISIGVFICNKLVQHDERLAVIESTMGIMHEDLKVLLKR